MSGFDDLNYSHIKSSLRRALISYIMEEAESPSAAQELASRLTAPKDTLPQAGARYTEQNDSRYDVGLGLQAKVIEQLGEPAQVFKTPRGYRMNGWNANMPGEGFFDHSALLLTVLAVNLDLPLSFLLLDGSLVNFHGGRMIWDQIKLRLQELQGDQITGLWEPTYRWKVRQLITPGSAEYNPSIAAAVKRGYNPFAFKFCPPGWPYVKPAEDVAAEDVAERRNLRSLKSILAARGVDEDDHQAEVINGRGKFIRRAIKEAMAIAKEFPEAELKVSELFREVLYGNPQGGVQATMLPISEPAEPAPTKKGAVE